MLSKRANEIIHDINNVRKRRKNIDFLLRKYHEKPEKEFIQKYAETQIAIFGVIAYLFTIVATIITLMLTIAFSIFPKNFEAYRDIYGVVLIVLFIFFVIFLYLFYNKLFKKDIFEEIIIKIEDVNMRNTVYFPTRNGRLDDMKISMFERIKAGFVRRDKNLFQVVFRSK